MDSEKKIKFSKKKKVIIGVIAALCLLFMAYSLYLLSPYMFLPKVTNEQLDNLDLSKYHKLMIVAHPDDELLWGGGHLIDDDYMVLCITRGNDPIRSNEFKTVLNETGDKGLILSYPDKVGKKRSRWTFWKKDIEKDIQTVINYKDWDEIVTHNEKGEYGHRHHIMTHELVAQACDELNVNARQMYFGTYYKAGELPDGLQHIDKKVLKQKKQIAKLYKSQKRTVKKFKHMLPYENWTERK